MRGCSCFLVDLKYPFKILLRGTSVSAACSLQQQTSTSALHSKRVHLVYSFVIERDALYGASRKSDPPDILRALVLVNFAGMRCALTVVGAEAYSVFGRPRMLSGAFVYGPRACKNGFRLVSALGLVIVPCHRCFRRCRVWNPFPFGTWLDVPLDTALVTLVSGSQGPRYRAWHPARHLPAPLASATSRSRTRARLGQREKAHFIVYCLTQPGICWMAHWSADDIWPMGVCLPRWEPHDAIRVVATAHPHLHASTSTQQQQQQQHSGNSPTPQTYTYLTLAPGLPFTPPSTHMAGAPPAPYSSSGTTSRFSHPCFDDRFFVDFNGFLQVSWIFMTLTARKLERDLKMPTLASPQSVSVLSTSKYDFHFLTLELHCLPCSHMTPTNLLNTVQGQLGQDSLFNHRARIS
ncbi:hypothetical protein K438DRAFT_1960736 [Mycena galopus ATCC 62051]|nr:hypothetical protein K438DRAFT_1960736 [Mycena galopus ATCC 62051]